MTTVVCLIDGKYQEKVLDLEKSTIELEFKRDMWFCYYRETNEYDVYAGLRTDDSAIQVFIKLHDGEPVDLLIPQWLMQLEAFPEFMPF